MTFGCTDRLTAVALYILEPSISEVLCDYLLSMFHREIQTHFLLINKCTILYLQVLQEMRNL